MVWLCRWQVGVEAVLAFRGHAGLFYLFLVDFFVVVYFVVVVLPCCLFFCYPVSARADKYHTQSNNTTHKQARKTYRCNRHQHHVLFSRHSSLPVIHNNVMELKVIRQACCSLLRCICVCVCLLLSVWCVTHAKTQQQRTDLSCQSPRVGA